MNEIKKTEKSKKKRPALGRGLKSLLTPSFQNESLRKVRFIEEEKSEISKKGSEESFERNLDKKGRFINEERREERAREEEALGEQLKAFSVKGSNKVKGSLFVKKLSIEQLQPNFNQPRKSFEEKSLDDLAASIEEKGLLQPILVRPLGSKSEKSKGLGRGLEMFEIIAGERRWRAAQKAGLFEVPVILKEASDQKSLEMALIENIQRKDLNPLEEAKAYEHLIKEYSLTQEKLAKLLGKDRVSLANVMRILKLPLEVQEAIGSGQVSLGLAKVLLSLKEREQQIFMLDKIIEENWTVRELTRQVEKIKRGENFQEEKKKLQDAQEGKKSFIFKLSDDLQKNLGSKVRIQYKRGQGKIIIHFYSDNELDYIAERLLR